MTFWTKLSIILMERGFREHNNKKYIKYICRKFSAQIPNRQFVNVIKKHKEIWCVRIGQEEIKLSFMDDMLIFLAKPVSA